MSRRRWAAVSGAALIAVVAVAVVSGVTGGALPTSGTAGAVASGESRDPATAGPTTAPVVRGSLASTVSVRGTLTHRARADGSPYVVIGQAAGTYTALPELDARVGCGDELYRVDERPVLVLCGAIPAYRDLRPGDGGPDVRQLNAGLHAAGADAAVGVELDPADDAFTDRTERALAWLQRDRGAAVTGELHRADVVVLPEPVRVAGVAAVLGGVAQPGAPVLDATAEALEVRVELQGVQQREVRVGDRARVTLPSTAAVTGTVDRIGTVGRVPGGAEGDAGSSATVGAAIVLDDPAQVDGLEHAPVQVEVTTEGVAEVLSVPVLAVVGRSGGGYAVEVVRDDGRRELVAVELGLFDSTAGRVEVEGDLQEGDLVVVPAS